MIVCIKVRERMHEQTKFLMKELREASRIHNTSSNTFEDQGSTNWLSDRTNWSKSTASQILIMTKTLTIQNLRKDVSSPMEVKPISYRSTLQECMTLSTASTKYIAASEATKEAICLRRLSANFSVKSRVGHPTLTLATHRVQVTSFETQCIMQRQNILRWGITTFGSSSSTKSSKSKKWIPR